MFYKLLRLLGAFLFLSAVLSVNANTKINAKSYIVTELDGTVLLSQDSATPRPIASITKLLMAEQLASHMNPSARVTIEPVDLASRYTSLKVNSTMSQDELLNLALVASSNQAIYALTRANGSADMIKAVNDAASARGLYSISIEEPSGLSKNNVASAEDLAKFVALMNDTAIGKASVKPTALLGEIKIKSTNPLLGKPGWNFFVSKTGFINASGGCLVSLLEVGGRKVVIVILGSANVTTRWVDLKQIKLLLQRQS